MVYMMYVKCLFHQKRMHGTVGNSPPDIVIR